MSWGVFIMFEIVIVRAKFHVHWLTYKILSLKCPFGIFCKLLNDWFLHHVINKLILCIYCYKLVLLFIVVLYASPLLSDVIMVHCLHYFLILPVFLAKSISWSSWALGASLRVHISEDCLSHNLPLIQFFTLLYCTSPCTLSYDFLFYCINDRTPTIVVCIYPQPLR